MPKLHELLAVERDMKAQAEKCRTDLAETFKKKEHHFTAKITQFKPYGEGEAEKIEEQLDLQTTVPKELKWVSEFIIKAMDVSYQVAEANTTARADVVLEDDTVLLKDMPTSALLELEKRMEELRLFVAAIPTLDPVKGFRPDPDRGTDVFKARDIVTVRTRKVTKFQSVAKATDKHPEQIKEVVEDTPTGDIVKMEWSGMLTVAVKGDMLNKVEVLARAVKKARARANEVDIPKTGIKIGATLINYVFGL